MCNNYSSILSPVEEEKALDGNSKRSLISNEVEKKQQSFNRKKTFPYLLKSAKVKLLNSSPDSFAEKKKSQNTQMIIAKQLNLVLASKLWSLSNYDIIGCFTSLLSSIEKDLKARYVRTPNAYHFPLQLFFTLIAFRHGSQWVPEKGKSILYYF